MDSDATSVTAGATVSRWRKFGHDRLYVSGPDGVRLGWLDATTGEEHIDATDRATEFREVLRLAGHHVDGRTADRGPAATDTEPDHDWHDLALNRPGQAAREQAEEQLAARRSRSRLLSAIARGLDVKTDERAWRKGAEGEETIGARLERLTDRGWHVLHSVPVGDRGSDIDHVLIGPGGVFTINTKNHPGKSIWVSPHQIRVDGQVQPYLRNSRFEADRAARLLTAAVGWEVSVKAVLALLTGTLVPNVTIRSGGPTDVLILSRMDIPRVFSKSAVRLTGEQVAQVFEQARRSTLWA